MSKSLSKEQLEALQKLAAEGKLTDLPVLDSLELEKDFDDLPEAETEDE